MPPLFLCVNKILMRFNDHVTFIKAISANLCFWRVVHNVVDNINLADVKLHPACVPQVGNTASVII